MEEGHSISVLMPKIEEQESVLISESIIDPTIGSTEDGAQFKRTDALNYVIQKLSKLVGNEKSKRSVLIGKRSHSSSALSLGAQEICDFAVKNIEIPSLPPPKKIKEEAALKEPGREDPPQSSRKPVCYQCSLCKSLCTSFHLLNEHIKEHGEHNEVMFMCSECRFTSKQQEELEAHIRSHLESNKNSTQLKVKPQCVHLSKAAFHGFSDGNDKCVSNQTNWDCKGLHVPESTSVTGLGIRKWYTYEQYGMYRCLICSYTCGQQRMLKTHAWKHAGEVDCSYPIFEDENEPASLPDSTVAQTPHGSEAVVLMVENKMRLPSLRPVQLQVCASEQFSHPSLPSETVVKGTEALSESDTPSLTEIVLEEETMSDTEQDNLITDSLLSSAQKIISCSENTKGHVNVIVERLPSAEETVSQKPFMRSTDLEVEKKLISEESQLACKEYAYAEKNTAGLEEILIGWCNTNKEEGDLSSSDGKAAIENSPPARRRTNSESLRLHSLAAEALVTMPIRAAELTRTGFRPITEVRSLDPDTGQRPTDADCTFHQKIGTSVESKSEEVTSLKWVDPEFVDIQRHQPDLCDMPVKMGISMSLLTVIEKLRERTDQNATDEDILKELQDNAQCQPLSDASLSGTDLVEYIPNVDRPYRCRLCHYSSDNKGYLKQHLRVHRPRQPYQCPICDHIANDSKDLENHMINHCKTRTYQCKQCEESFYYKSQLRNHERDQHSLPDTQTAASDLSPAGNEEMEAKCAPEDQASSQKLYKCDVCEYTSISYVGVRNHRRIHNSDKPYRCQVCDFATTNMNSLKCHMKRHPQEHQTVQLMEQYKCSLCGYVCSHPPSLKSHMWKHASDQNYNYEQVNRAINDAISQSSRVQEEYQSNVQDGAEETAESFFDASENLISLSELASQTSNDMVAPGEAQKQGLLRNSLCNFENSLPQPRPGMEYCVLLFCCCICGFESTSKEHLMDHMKGHEGEIINIILSKEPNATQSTN